MSKINDLLEPQMNPLQMNTALSFSATEPFLLPPMKTVTTHQSVHFPLSLNEKKRTLEVDPVIRMEPRLHMISETTPSMAKKKKKFDLHFDVKVYHPPTFKGQDLAFPKNMGAWSKEEDELLGKGMDRYGTQWTRISKEFVKTRNRSSIAQRGRCLYQSKLKQGNEGERIVWVNYNNGYSSK